MVGLLEAAWNLPAGSRVTHGCAKRQRYLDVEMPMFRIALILSLFVLGPVVLKLSTAKAQDAAKPGCLLSGSAGVAVNGMGMLRLGDVAGCPNIKYEIVPGLMIDGQPAVRIVSDSNCVAAGSSDVLVDGKSASRQGDVMCR